jgi:hypothetical protein
MPSHPHVPGCARLNLARLNAFRLNAHEYLTFASIGGIDQSANVRIEGAAVQHVLNDQPDTAAVRVHGFVPVAGQPFALYSGDRSVDRQIFGGRILETTVLYESRKQNVAYDLQAIDPTWLLNRRLVLYAYTNVSASAIVLDLVARFTTGVTVNHVARLLPIIDAITFTNETVASCLTAICERVGAYWYLDYGVDLHVFTDEGVAAPTITDAEPRGSSDHTLTEDLSQIVTRVVARGGSGEAFVDVASGATEIPVTEDAWFSDAGGVVEAGSLRLTYTGVKGRSQTGALVGTLTTPTSTLQPVKSNGAGLGAGTYQYAQTLTSASGETLPGPIATVVGVGATAQTLQKTTARQGNQWSQSGLTPGGVYSWRVALLYVGGGWALGPPTDYFTVSGTHHWQIWTGMVATDPTNGLPYYPALQTAAYAPVNQIQIYRTTNGGATWYIDTAYDGVTGNGTGWLAISKDNNTDSVIVNYAPYPTGPIAMFSRVTVHGIESAAGSFTGTKLYRTAANGAQLKLLQTNPPIDFVDTAADATLGGNAPTTDTSGVPPSNGQVVVGANTLPVTSIAPFTADGGAGWAQVGNIPIRYTGTAAGALTGLPATGVGSITATVKHGTQVLVIARLTGVAGLTRALAAGDPVTLRVEVEDAAAQAALGARLGGTATDGIVEEAYSDSRMTAIELTNYARALLFDRKDPRVMYRFVTRDTNVRVGRLITVDIASPPIHGTFRVQRITFDEIAISGGLSRTEPRRTVEASNKLYTMADLLRRLSGREGGAW